MSFNDFVHKNKLKKKGTSKLKFYQILPSFYLIDVGIHQGDEPFSSVNGIVNLLTSKRTHWVAYINEVVLVHVAVLFQTNYLRSI